MLSQAVILCGGLGTRLGELTRDTPKPLLPVGGKPFLHHLVQEVARYGIEEVLLLAGRHGDKVSRLFDGRTLFGARVSVLIEPRPLGTAGALRHALDALSPSFFVLNGDTWIDADLVSIAGHWTGARDEGSPSALMLLRRIADARRFGSVTFAGGRVTGFAEKETGQDPKPGLINAGVYVLDRGLVEALPADTEVSLERDVFPGLASRGRIRGTVAPDGAYFIDIGIPETYAASQTELIAARTRAALLLDRDVLLDADARATVSGEPAWTPGAREAVKRANARGHFVFVMAQATGEGDADGAAALRIHRRMQTSLLEIGAHIDAFAMWPPHRDAAIGELLGAWPVDRPRSLLVGRTPRAVEAAACAGVRGVTFGDGRLADAVAAAMEE